MSKLNIPRLRAMTSDKDCIKVVAALFQAVAYCETVRSVIEPKQQEVVDTFKFEISKDHQRKRERDGIVKSFKHIYLASDEDFELYWKEMNAFHKEKGFTKPSSDHCPLLMAESVVRDLKKNVCDFLEPYLNISYDNLAGTIEPYKNYFELVMTMFSEKVEKYNRENPQKAV